MNRVGVFHWSISRVFLAGLLGIQVWAAGDGGNRITVHSGAGIRTLKMRESRRVGEELNALLEAKLDLGQTFGSHLERAKALYAESERLLKTDPIDYAKISEVLDKARKEIQWIRQNEVLRSAYVVRSRELGELIVDTCEQLKVTLSDKTLTQVTEAMKQAALKFDQGELGQSMEIFKRCEALLRQRIDREVMRLLKEADAHIKAGAWDLAMNCLLPAERMAPRHPSIGPRMKVVRQHAVTTLRVVATVKGKEVPASVHVDGEWERMPLVRDVEKGTKISLRIVYSQGTHWYGAATAYYTCDWFGEKRYEVELLPEVGPRVRHPWRVKICDDKHTAMELAFIRAGNFKMGRQRGEQSGDLLHDVELRDSFWLGRMEVTQAQWERLMGRNPSFHKISAKHPVDNVSWDEAMLFCRKLTQQERLAGRLPGGYVYTLPTEAQWEYACRAGENGPFAFGDDDLVLPLYGNVRGVEDGFEKVSPVGSFRPNRWGLYDMHGNVSEWCRDFYGTYSGLKEINPHGPEDAEHLRVHRGGDWGHDGSFARSFMRDFATPSFHDETIGFRVALVRVRKRAQR